jgi:hypothetical protein
MKKHEQSTRKYWTRLMRGVAQWFAKIAKQLWNCEG